MTETRQSNFNQTSSSEPLVVGVGASAGGLEAFEEFLRTLGDAPRMAIVLVQHLDSAAETLLTELLPNSSPFAVQLATENVTIQPGVVYVCPAGRNLEVSGIELRVTTPVSDEQKANNIDSSFSSLASARGLRSVGIVLSGSGTDGTLGLKAISDSGGLTFAQLPESAKFDHMPRSAATTGVADHVLPPDEIAAELLRYEKHLFAVTESTTDAKRHEQITEAVPKIAEILLRATNHNFQHYKTSTLGRRIRRRMQLLKIGRIDEYVSELELHEDEQQSLFRELLIGVTSFFRDPDAFESLNKNVLEKIFEGKTSKDTIRIWVAGCANGAEAYSVAMLCRERVEASTNPPEVQIFATDIDHRALQQARTGSYPTGIEDQIKPERLHRFFFKRGKRYHVCNEIRDMVLFSSHNLISDPPFSRQDLITCRNLLIYLGPHLQNKLIPMFHYALRPSGYLFLGPSENIASHGELFRQVDGKQRISQRKGTAAGSTSGMTFRPGITLMNQGDADDTDADLTQIMQRIALDEFTPKTAVIDESGQILTSASDMGKYLTISGGPFHNNIIKMAHPSLRIGLRTAISEAKKKRRKVEHPNLSIRVGELVQQMMITVQPMPRLGEVEPLFLVVFHDVGLPVSRDRFDNGSATPIHDADRIIAQLDRELETTRTDLDKTLQEMEAANEELKSSNEELLSINEELQSANEELETSKEEIRAGSDAVARANTNMENLLRSTQIATIFLDDGLKIQGFTPAATEIYALLPTDIGRSLEHFVPLVDNMPPIPDPATVVDGDSHQQTIMAKSGKAFIRRVMPYLSQNGDVEGIVLTFTDVTELRDSQELFQSLVEISSQIVWITDAHGNITDDSPSWRAFTGQSVAEFRGRGWLDAIHPDDREKTLQKWNEAVDNSDRFTTEYRLKHHTDGWRWTQVRAVAHRNHDGSVRRWVGMNVDITDRKRWEQELSDREMHLRRVIDNTAGFIGVLDTNGILLEANATAVEATGLTRDDLLGKPFWECYWWSYDSEVVERLRRAFEETLKGTSVRYDETIRLANDARTIIDFMMVPIRDEQGLVTHVIPSGVDVHDRKAAEDQVREHVEKLADEQTKLMALLSSYQRAESKLKVLFDHGYYDTGIVELDGTISEINEIALRHLGCRRDDVVGKRFWECPWWNADPTVVRRLQEGLASASEGRIFHEDLPFVLPSGARRIMDFVFTPARDPNGNVIFVVANGSDVTDRKKTENALAESNRRFSMAISAGEMAVWEWTPEKSIWEPQLYDLLGLDRNLEASTDLFFNSVHPEDVAALKAAWADVVAGKTYYEQEFRIIRPDGSILWIAGVGDVFKSSDGKIQGIFGLNWDITPQKEIEASLLEARKLAEAANESKSAFLANMSHEIRTPMAAILGYTDLVAEKVSDTQALRYIQTIRRNGDFLLNIINDILDISKIEAGKFEIRSERFAPHQLVEDVRSIMAVRADEHNLDLEVFYEGQIPAEINSDPKRVKQVLVNLVGNAIKFTPKGSVQIKVSFHEQPSPHLRFDIVDSGIGISEQQKKTLFQAFSQGDHRVNREFGGTGLGLAISRRLIEMLGGSIDVSSVLGEGSTFTVTLATPGLDDVERIEPQLVVEPVDEHREQTSRSIDCDILVVDDRRDIRFLTKAALARAGATVSEAEDGLVAGYRSRTIGSGQAVRSDSAGYANAEARRISNSA
ncbi:MAG: PAS domain S-box protein [Pirellulaceae bacterium]